MFVKLYSANIVFGLGRGIFLGDNVYGELWQRLRKIQMWNLDNDCSVSQLFNAKTADFSVQKTNEKSRICTLRSTNEDGNI